MRQPVLAGLFPGDLAGGGDPLMVMVTAAGQLDRELLARLRMLHPQLTLIWGDSAYAGTLVEWASRFLRLTFDRRGNHAREPETDPKAGRPGMDQASA
jgi:hypothetical protein